MDILLEFEGKGAFTRRNWHLFLQISAAKNFFWVFFCIFATKYCR